MDGFDTISLDTNICDICNQDTGEALINCILNDRCLQVADGTSSSFDMAEPFKQAHKECLDKWKSVIQSTLNSRCPSPKRSWKDKLKDLLNRNDESTRICTWVEVDGSKSSSSKSSRVTNYSHVPSLRTNTFLTKEEYRVEEINDGIDECLERGRKLRVCSVDIEDEEDSPNDTNQNCQNKQVEHENSWTSEKLRGLQHAEILEIHQHIKQRIKEVSSLLIKELEEKDALQQQADSLHTTVAQLVQLQQRQNIKTLSLDFEQLQHPVS